ncbi:MAG: glycoside hydrolase family protein, partial [Notoacmeibacter sp.]
MAQRTSNKGLMELIAHEAIVLTPYRDVKDVWTIGIGHTAAAGGINPAKFNG